MEGKKRGLVILIQNHFLQYDLSLVDVEVMWNEFKEAVHSTISKHIPQRILQSNNNLPWINKHNNNNNKFHYYYHYYYYYYKQIKKDTKTRKRLYDTAKKKFKK